MKNVLKFGVVFFTILNLASCNDDDTPACTPNLSLEEETVSINMLAANHYQAYTNIIINASPEKVWEVLTDFETMPNWSSSFQGLTGDIENGGSVKATYILPQGTFDIPHTLIYEEGIKFGWSDPTGVTPFGSYVDNHLFIVERISDCQTRFIQSDDFKPVSSSDDKSKDFATFIAESYKAFNKELKAEVEN